MITFFELRTLGTNCNDGAVVLVYHKTVKASDRSTKEISINESWLTIWTDLQKNSKKIFDSNQFKCRFCIIFLLNLDDICRTNIDTEK